MRRRPTRTTVAAPHTPPGRPQRRPRQRQRQRFVGEIVSTGTASGDRIVVGRWVESPFGAFTDLMHEDPQGVRTLFAPSTAIADYVQATYTFDDVRIVPIASTRHPDSLRVDGGPWSIRFGIGRRTRLGKLLRVVPSRLATAPWWCGLIDPVARVVQRGVRTRGTAGGGRIEWYGAVDQHDLERIEAEADGRDLGALADVHPPVRFGFSSAPRRPSIVALTTTIEIDAPDGAR